LDEGGSGAWKDAEEKRRDDRCRLLLDELFPCCSKTDESNADDEDADDAPAGNPRPFAVEANRQDVPLEMRCVLRQHGCCCPTMVLQKAYDRRDKVKNAMMKINTLCVFSGNAMLANRNE